jgi:hypothetical protein
MQEWRGQSSDMGLFIFTDNSTAEHAFYIGTSSPMLFELVEAAKFANE